MFLRKLMPLKRAVADLLCATKIVDVLKLRDCSPPITWGDAARIFLQERKFPTPGVMLLHHRH